MKCFIKLAAILMLFSVYRAKLLPHAYTSQWSGREGKKTCCGGKSPVCPALWQGTTCQQSQRNLWNLRIWCGTKQLCTCISDLTQALCYVSLYGTLLKANLSTEDYEMVSGSESHTLHAQLLFPAVSLCRKTLHGL